MEHFLPKHDVVAQRMAAKPLGHREWKIDQSHAGASPPIQLGQEEPEQRRANGIHRVHRPAFEVETPGGQGHAAEVGAKSLDACSIDHLVESILSVK